MRLISCSASAFLLVLLQHIVAISEAVRVPIWPATTTPATRRTSRLLPLSSQPVGIAVDLLIKPKGRSVIFIDDHHHHHHHSRPKSVKNPRSYQGYWQSKPTQQQQWQQNTFAHPAKHFVGKSSSADKHVKEQIAIGSEIHEPFFKPVSYESFPISDHDQVWAQQPPFKSPFVQEPEITTSSSYNAKPLIKPDGYEVFEDLQNDFMEQRKKFANDLKEFPRNHKISAETIEDESEPYRQDDPVSSEEASAEFVPIRTYTQVRKSEDEQHLPSEQSIEPNLKEVVKDSKIHTVYTEDGYEDSAYDHAAHIKNAENSEGFTEFSKESDRVHPVKDTDSAESFATPMVVMAKNNKFAKTTQVKTASLKDMGNGNLELEIKSQVKLLETPNNGTEVHKYINISPKIVHRALPLLSPTTIPKSIAQNISSINFTKIFPNFIPTLDSPTSNLIKADIDKHFQKRVKRNVDKSVFRDFHKIDVDEFNLPNTLPTTTETSIMEKYPYYNVTDRNVNPDSPIRYAEDLYNIPEKKDGNMAFYDQADRKSECSEVESDIDPVPDRIKEKNEDSEDSSEVAPAPKLPRLGSLGDKIDCFKNKYFGKNPLDSPIFTEETVGQPIPIFKEFEKQNSVHSDPTQLNTVKPANIENTTPFFSILTTPDYGVDTQPKHIYDQIDLLESFGQHSQPLKKPKSLEERIEKTINSSQSYRQPKVSDLIFDVQNSTESKINETIVPFEPVVDADYYDELVPDNSTIANATTGETLPESLPLIIVRRRRKRPYHYNRFRPSAIKRNNIYTQKKFLPPSNKYPTMTVDAFNQIFPTTTYSPKYNVISEVHYKDDIKPNEQLNVFADIINNIKNASMFDEINAQSAKVDPITVKLNTNTHMQKTTSTRRIKVPIRKYKIRQQDVQQDLSGSESQDVGIKNNYFNEPPIVTGKPYVPNYYGKTKSKISKPQKSNEQIYEEFMNALKNNENTPEIEQQIDSFFKPNNYNTEPINIQRKRKRKPITNQYGPVEDVVQEISPEPIQPSGTEEQPVAIDDTEKAIYKKKRPMSSYTTIDEKPLNIYYVPGMKPPPSRERPILYSDYKLTIPSNTFRRRMDFANHRIRRKRSALPYADIERTNLNRRPSTVESSENADEEEDDYVPHRPTNFHYDPETKRIVYDKPIVQGDEEEEEEEDIEEDEEEEIIRVTKAPRIQTTTKRTVPKTIYHKDVLNMKNGPTLIDFINKLKSDPTYVVIKDPEPTEKPEPANMTTSEPMPGKTADFLNVLSKLHTNPDYKEIKDPDEDKTAKKKTTTTTESPEEKEEDDEEAVVVEEDKKESNVNNRYQNSPGGQFGNGATFMVFDISEYLPKVKTYNPKTSIDYSKYKTIERTTPATTPATTSTTTVTTKMSSRYKEKVAPDDDNDEVEEPIKSRDQSSNENNEEVFDKEKYRPVYRGQTSSAEKENISQESSHSDEDKTKENEEEIKTLDHESNSKENVAEEVTSKEQSEENKASVENISALDFSVDVSSTETNRNRSPNFRNKYRPRGNNRRRPATHNSQESSKSSESAESKEAKAESAEVNASKEKQETASSSNEDRSEESSKVVHSEQLQGTTEQPIVTVTPEYSTTSTTIRSRVNIRRRRPIVMPSTTTSRSTSATTEHDEITEGSEETYTRATHRPPSRVYPRRPSQRIRIRTKGTTEATTAQSEDSSTTVTSRPRRVIQRRHGTFSSVFNGIDVPRNHKPVYTPLQFEDRSDEGANTQVKLSNRKRPFVLAAPGSNVNEIRGRSLNDDDGNEEVEVFERQAKQAGGNGTGDDGFVDKNPGKPDPRFNDDDGDLKDVLHHVIQRIIEDESRQVTPHPDVITARNFDVTSAGSHQQINQLTNEVISEAGYIQPRKIDVEVFKSYDPTQKHGGNYKRQPIASTNEVPLPTAYEIEYSDEIKRLSDVVPKPFAFYSDPKLPARVNALNVEAEPVDATTATAPEAETEAADYDYTDAVKIFFKGDRSTTSTTASPAPIRGIIKDPSKRLYFYAAVD